MILENNNVLFNMLMASVIAPCSLFFFMTLVGRILWVKSLFSNQKIVGFSAGFLIALTFIHFIPHSLESGTPFSFSITLLLSLLFLICIEIYIIPNLSFLKSILPSLSNTQTPECSHYHQYHHHPFSHSQSFSAIGCLLVCIFFDGMRLGSSLLIDTNTAIFTSIAVVAHIMPEAIVVLSLAIQSQLSKKACLLLQAVLCLFLGQGILSATIFHVNFDESIVLSISSATFLYVIFIHLLPTAVQKENRTCFFTTLISSTLLLYYLSQVHTH